MTGRPRGLVALPVALVAAYAATTVASGSSTTSDTFYAATVLTSIGLAIHGLRSEPPERLAPWIGLVATMGLWFVGDVLYDTFGTDANVNPADIPYLVGYAILIGSVWQLVPRKQLGDDLSWFLDLCICGIAATYVIWQFAVAPIWAGPEDPVLQELVATLYPTGDVILLVLVLQLIHYSGRRTCTTVGLGVATASLLVADVTYAFMAATGDHPEGTTPLVTLWLIGYLGLGIAASHGGAHARVADEPIEGFRLGQILVGTVALVAVLVAAGVAWLGSIEVTIEAMVATAALIVVLGIVRFLRIALAVESTRQELVRRERYFRTLALNSSDVSLVLDRDLTVVDTSRAPIGLTEVGLEPHFRTHPLAILEPDDRIRVVEVFERARRDPGQSFVIEARILQVGDAEIRWLELRFTNLEHDPVVEGTVVNVSEITERKRVAAELEHHVLHDPLTGIANRFLFRDRLAQALGRLDRNDGTVSVVFVDLDGFKEVNDRFGQHAGDDLLCEVAERLTGVVRTSDTVARLSGDEFALVLDTVGDEVADVEAAVARLRAALTSPYPLGDEMVTIGFSVGIATATAPASIDDTLRNADLALYAAKSSGGGVDVVYTPAMDEEAADRRQLSQDLYRAVERDELVLHVQPLVHLPDRSIRGFEALVRWNHPRRGLLSPACFIGIAEESGTIVEIGDWVMREACRAAAGWNRDHPELGPLEIAVNLSALQLADPRLTRKVLTALADAGLDPERLVLELTESVLIDRPEEANAHLRTLKDMGIRVAIADFGTGYSSLPYLQQFAVDILKIDRGYIRSIDGTELPPLVQGMLELSRSLRADCIAEGIEEPHQLEALLAAGCVTGQGYLFSKPVTLDAAAALLREAAQDRTSSQSTVANTAVR